MFKFDAKHIAAYLLLGLGFAVVMGFMYMQYVYYDAMIETFGVSNAELGLLITILGITALVTALPLGALADRLDCKKALSFSLFAMMIGVGILALIPTYPVAIGVWLCDGIVMSLWYSAIYKVVRVIAPPDAVGKSFGMFGIGTALGSIVVNVAGLALYDYFAETFSLQMGLSSILWAFFTAGMISSIGGYLLIRGFKVQGDDAEEKEKTNVKTVLRALKSPSVWLYVLGCFCIYSFQVSISYFTPYFTAVLGASLTFSGVVAIFRQYGLRIISAPFGGWLGDRIGGTAKVIRGSFAILVVFVLIVLFLPSTTPIWALVILVFAIGLLGTMNISLQASISEDALVPPEQMGLAVGMTALLTADLFQPAMFGAWLDAFGNTGYTYIWVYTIAILVIGIIVLTVMIRRKKKLLGETSLGTKENKKIETVEKNEEATIDGNVEKADIQTLKEEKQESVI